MAEPLTDIEALRDILTQRPLALISDIDGTLAPIAPRPEDAKVSARCRDALERLTALGIKVILVTGRELAVARNMIPLDGAVYAANHGLSLWVDGRVESPPGLRRYSGLAQKVAREVSGVEASGVHVEEKGPVLAFHYRQAADEAAARRAIASAIARSAAAKEFAHYEGRKVTELRPPLGIDKGTALTDVVARLGARAVVCAGDDATDIEMFRAVARLRAGGMPGVSVAVVSDEATAEVLAGADYRVDGVPGMEWLLDALVRALREMRPSGPGTGAPTRT